MYVAYFGLKEAPFRLTPDPIYLYMSGYHGVALAHLLQLKRHKPIYGPSALAVVGARSEREHARRN